MTSLNLDLCWKALKTDLANCDTEMEFPTKQVEDVTTAEGQVRVGVNKEGQYLLLLPCDSRLLRKTLPNTTGLDLNVQSYTVKGKNKLFLELLCLVPELNQTFTDVVKNICERIEQGQGPLQSVKESIEEFRELLKQASLRVTDDEILGLLGELLQLELFVKHNIDAIDNWSGPDKKRHDFIFNGVSVEVKTSQRTGAPVIKIHGLEQLDVSEDGSLLLSYFRVEAVPEGGMTIPALIDKLKLKISHVALKEKLNLYNYSDKSRSHWEKYRWNLLGKKHYVVDENFPKLTKTELGGKPLPGISEIQYSVNLDLANNNLISEEQLISDVMECKS